MPTHLHLIATFASSTPPPITPTTHHIGRPPPSHDDQRGNATSPIEQWATLMRGNDDGNPSCHIAVSNMATRQWTTMRSVPPSPYCLLTPEPGATSAMWQLGSEWSSFVVWFWPNTTQQQWMDSDDRWPQPRPQCYAMARCRHEQLRGPTTTHQNNSPSPPPALAMRTQAQHHPTNDDNDPAPPHQWWWQWPTTSTTPQTANMAQHHPTNQCPRTMTTAHYQHLPTPYEQWTWPTTTPYQWWTQPTTTPYQQQTRATISPYQWWGQPNTSTHTAHPTPWTVNTAHHLPPPLTMAHLQHPPTVRTAQHHTPTAHHHPQRMAMTAQHSPM